MATIYWNTSVFRWEVTSSNRVPEIISQYYRKAVRRVKGALKKIKADDGTENLFIEPIRIYLRSPNDNTGDPLRYCSIVSSPVNQRIESYGSKFVVDCLGWWKSFFKGMVDLEIFDPSVSGLALWVFYEKNLQTLQMNGIAIYFSQTETIRHLVGLTLCTSYLVFMKLQTTWSILTQQKPTNLLILPMLYSLIFLISLVSLQRHWWIKIIWICHVMRQVLLTCTYIFWVKLGNTVRLPWTYLVLRVLNFAIFASFCQIAKVNTPEIKSILFSQNWILAKWKTFLMKNKNSTKDFG